MVGLPCRPPPPKLTARCYCLCYIALPVSGPHSAPFYVFPQGLNYAGPKAGEPDEGRHGESGHLGWDSLEQEDGSTDPGKSVVG